MDNHKGFSVELQSGLGDFNIVSTKCFAKSIRVVLQVFDVYVIIMS